MITGAIYDKLYAASGNSYERDVRAIATLARADERPATTLLEVGCATGGHLAAFEGIGFACAGVEADLKLAAIARSRLAETRIEPADLTTFDFEARYDVVVSLGGASAAVRTVARLDASIERMAAHLAPGGTVVVEPFLFFGSYRPGKLDSIFVDEPELRVARMSLSKQTGKLGILDYHYLIATLQGVERAFERREVGLFDESIYRKAFERAGLSFAIVADGERLRYVGR